MIRETKAAVSDLSRRPAGGDRAPVIRIDRRPAADDTDSATRSTIEMMCEYIRTSSQDPFVRACADYAWRRFGLSSPDLAMKAWACFWWVKHCLKFRVDEATMFRIGEENQQDLLISPDVLLRMVNPAEDCDGFTMTEATLLHILGVPVVIATVAASPDDPERWSHVFPVAVINGAALPLDASHGSGPGWMVPPEHIFRWQAWGLDGKPVSVRPMRHRGLHNYVATGPVRGRGFGAAVPRYRRRGVGDLCSDFGVGCDISGPTDTGPYLQDSTSIWGPTPLSSGTPGSGSSSSVWSFLSNLVGSAATVAKTAVTPTTTYTLPNGTVVSGPAGSIPSSALTSSSMLPILGIGVFAVIVISMMGKK